MSNVGAFDLHELMDMARLDGQGLLGARDWEVMIALRDKLDAALSPESERDRVRVDRETLAHLLKIYELAQGSLFAEGQISPGGEFYDDLVDAVDDERNVDWMIAVRATLNEAQP